MGNRGVLLLILVLLAACCFLFVCCLLLGSAGYLILRPQPSTGPYLDLPQAPTTAPDALPTLVPLPASEAACPGAMQQVIDSVESQEYDTTPGLSGDSHTRSVDFSSVELVSYIVDGDSLTDPYYTDVAATLEPMQQDLAPQQSTWSLFTALIPAGRRTMLEEYVIFTDGPGDILAAVEQSYDDPDLWALEVDPADMQDRDTLVFTLVHEFAHLLSLNSTQVTPDLEIFNDPGNEQLYERRAQACSTYFPGEGCSLPDSYINAFYSRFWPGILDEWQAVDELSAGDDLEGYYEELYAFYETHQDQFVNDYAATDPAEDLAESFSYFIFGSRPSGESIAKQKILFFYEYPELISLREQILQNFCEAAK